MDTTKEYIACRNKQDMLLYKRRLKTNINKKMQNIDLKFDLFKLHVSEEDIKMKHSWIGVKSNVSLHNKLNKMLATLLSYYPSQKELGIKLAKKLNCATHSPLRHIIEIIKRREHWIPLYFIESVVELYSEVSDKEVSKLKKNLQKDFELLRVGNGSSKEVKSVNTLHENLCKIAGSHAADGTIKEGYRLVLSDEYNSSVVAFSKLIEKSFGLKTKIEKIKGKNAWQASFRNKVIVRYLTNFFGFPKGKKFDTVDVPIIIKKAPLNLQKAFVCGVFTFDGCVRFDKSISFSSRSKKLCNSLYDIIIKSGLQINKVVGTSHNQPMYVLRTNTKISRKELFEWLHFFEPRTRKHLMIKEIMSGYKFHYNSLGESLNHLEKSLHHRIKKPIIKMIKLASQLNEFTTIKLYQKAKYKISFTTFESYFRFLKRCKILVFNERKEDRSVTYLYNQNISNWRLPIRRQ